MILLAALFVAVPYSARSQNILPDGVREIPEDLPYRTFARHRYEVTPPHNDAALVVTFYFDESRAGYLRVLWGQWPSEATLIQNLFEGVGVPNQRTLILTPEQLARPGILTVLSGAAESSMLDARFRWVDSYLLWSDDPAAPALWLEGTGAFSEQEIHALPLPVATDSFHGTLSRAVLAAQPVRIEHGTVFAFEFQSPPAHTRLSGEFIGLPLDADVEIWVNGHLVRHLPLASPALDDPGWQTRPDGSTTYAGWRTASVLIPPDVFQPGENRVLFHWPAAEDRPYAPYFHPAAVKNLILECAFGPSNSKTPDSSSTFFSNDHDPWLLPPLPDEFLSLPEPY